MVFVPLSAPGDRVRARVERVHASHARARLVEVLHPGPERVEPPCALYGQCGGCSWMHLSERGQLDGYEAIVRESFARIGRILSLPPIEVLRSPERLGYRSRARVVAGPRSVGFRASGSRGVVDVGRCGVLDIETQRQLSRLRSEPPRRAMEVEVRGFGDEVAVSGDALHVGPESFFQANRLLWDAWQARVAAVCGRGRCLVELYAGVGFYTVALTRRFDRVVAVERGIAAEDARRNTTAEVIHAAAEEWAPLHLAGVAPEVVLVNPPRVGCDASVLQAVRRAAPRRCVYASCEPTTLARDVRLLSPDYRVMEILLIDALPQTHHVEVLCVLDRNSAESSTGNVLTAGDGDS